MKKTLLYLAAAVLIAVFPACGVDEVEINNVEDFEAYVLDEMDFQNIPAAAVLVFEGEEVLYENYFGSSNLEQDLPLAADHLFLMASVSKVITATALLQLRETGAFELNDRINDYLPFDVSVPGYSTDITFQVLLTHTSGIADNFDEMDKHYYYGQDSPIALSFFIENYLVSGGMYYDGDKNFTGAEPGTEHEYSNIGTALIGVLVEELSGTDFNTYCQQNIFSPLGMNQTSWRLDQVNGTIVTPYDDIDGENQAIVHYTNTDYPNGGLRTTARDMHQFLKAFVQGGFANNHQLLSAETINDMIRLQIPNKSDEMGLHLFLMDQENNLWGHDGGEQGVATIMGFNPSTKIGAIIFTNQGEADVEEWLSQAYTLGVKL